MRKLVGRLIYWIRSKFPHKQYYLDFTEELIMNENYPEYRAGRIELRNSFISSHSIKEFRIFTKNFNEFMNMFEPYMWKHYTKRRLEIILKKFEQFNDFRIKDNNM